MQPLDIPAANLPDYERALRTSGVVDTSADVLDLDGRHVTSLSAVAEQGQVLVDRHGKINRALRVWFDDPAGTIDFDPNSPSPTALYFSHMLQVTISVYVPELSQQVTAVPFTGPLYAFDRNGRHVYVEAHSKETLARVPAWDPLTLLKGTPKDEAIQTLLEAAGETQFDLPDLTGEELRRTISLDRFGDRWQMAQGIAASLDLQLHYRGDGVCTARQLPTVPAWTFSTADAVDDPDDADVIGAPRVRRSRERFFNTVEVLGTVPRAGQPRIRAVAQPPDDHEASPVSLVRGGQPGIFAHRRHLPQLQDNDQAQAAADRILADGLINGVDPKFTALPVYHLTEGDTAALETADDTVVFRLDRFALPVGTRGGGVMSVGYHSMTTNPEASDL